MIFPTRVPKRTNAPTGPFWPVKQYPDTRFPGVNPNGAPAPECHGRQSPGYGIAPPSTRIRHTDLMWSRRVNSTDQTRRQIAVQVEQTSVTVYALVRSVPVARGGVPDD